MSKFKYVAVTKEGKRVIGEKEAESKEEIVDFLYSKGLTIISVSEDLNLDLKEIGEIEIGGLSLSEKVVLVKQLTTMVTAGVPIIQAIDILVQQAEKSSLQKKLRNIYKKIEAGISLSEAFSQEGGIFTEVQINLLSAGEKSGNLNEMLEKIAVDMEKSKNLRGKIMGAMIYPVIIFVIMAIVLIIMIIFMVPQVEDLYGNFSDVELPIMTRVLIAIGNFLGNPVGLIILILLGVGTFALYKYYYSTESGEVVIDKWKLKIPIFGDLMGKVALTQFSRVTSMLLRSGIPILETMGIVSRATGNVTFVNTIQSAQEDVKQGESLAVSLAKNNADNAFPMILLRIISTGEQSGKLDQVLEDMSDFYEAEVDQITNNLTKLMEPFILIIVGALVGFLAIAVYSPMYELGSQLQA